MVDGSRGPEEGAEGPLAPVIPLFGSRPGPSAERAEPASRAKAAVDAGAGADAAWHITWTDDASGEQPVDEAEAEYRAAAEAALLKKLRARSLSVRESRAFLIEQGLADEGADAVVDGLLRHGYLDDLRLAEQLVYIGTDRKRQGRVAIAQTLASRGIPRDIADAALADSDDDDAERALAFARHKAASLRALDRDVALRRLMGQLARRGYAGSLAMMAARTALDELAGPAARSTVRFE